MTAAIAMAGLVGGRFAAVLATVAFIRGVDGARTVSGVSENVTVDSEFRLAAKDRGLSRGLGLSSDDPASPRPWVSGEATVPTSRSRLAGGLLASSPRSERLALHDGESRPAAVPFRDLSALL